MNFDNLCTDMIFDNFCDFHLRMPVARPIRMFLVRTHRWGLVPMDGSSTKLGQSIHRSYYLSSQRYRIRSIGRTAEAKDDALFFWSSYSHCMGCHCPTFFDSNVRIRTRVDLPHELAVQILPCTQGSYFSHTYVKALCCYTSWRMWKIESVPERWLSGNWIE